MAAGVGFHVGRGLGPAHIGMIGLYVRYIVRSTFKQEALSQGRRPLGKQGSPGIMTIWRIVDRRRVASGRQKRNAALLAMTVGRRSMLAARAMSPSAAMLVPATQAWRAGRLERTGDGLGADG